MKYFKYIVFVAIFFAGIVIFSQDNKVDASHQSGACPGAGGSNSYSVTPLLTSPQANSTVSAGSNISLTVSLHYCSSSFRPMAVVSANVTAGGSTLCSKAATLNRGSSSHPFCSSHTVPNVSGNYCIRIDAVLQPTDGVTYDARQFASQDYCFNVTGSNPPPPPPPPPPPGVTPPPPPPPPPSGGSVFISCQRLSNTQTQVTYSGLSSGLVLPNIFEGFTGQSSNVLTGSSGSRTFNGLSSSNQSFQTYHYPGSGSPVAIGNSLSISSCTGGGTPPPPPPPPPARGTGC